MAQPGLNTVHDDLIKPLGISLLLIAWWGNGLLNLGEGERVWRIMNSLGALKRLLQGKHWACAQSNHVWQEKKPASYSETNRHKFWNSSVHFESQLDGSPECWPKIRRRENLIFLSISCLSMKTALRNYASSYDPRWDWGQKAEYAMEAPWLTPSSEKIRLWHFMWIMC